MNDPSPFHSVEAQAPARTDEDTVPDRNVPPSQRDLSTHRPGCNCMGCFYADDR